MARPRSDIDVRIVHAARDRFLREGVDGASLRAIAADAGTSVGMVSYYFPTKEELFLAVVEEIYGALIEEMAAALAAPASAEERVRGLYRRMGRATDEEIVVIQIVIREMLTSGERRKMLLDRFLHGHIPIVLRFLGDAREAGEIDAAQPAPVQLLALVAVGLLPQLIRRVAGADLPLPLPGDALPDLLAQIALHGLGVPR